MTWEPGERIFSIWELFDLKAEILAEEPQDSIDGSSDPVRCIYIGTVFNLTPSGKYYMPWACSNVEPCQKCKGSGTIDTPVSKRLPVEQLASFNREALALDRRIRDATIRFYGHWHKGDWPLELETLLAETSNIVSLTSKKTECNHCEGIGSREAYLDTAWYEELEKELAEIGAFYFHGEGDPCDILVGISVDEEEGKQ